MPSGGYDGDDDDASVVVGVGGGVGGGVGDGVGVGDGGRLGILEYFKNSQVGSGGQILWTCELSEPVSTGY